MKMKTVWRRLFAFILPAGDPNALRCVASVESGPLDGSRNLRRFGQVTDKTCPVYADLAVTPLAVV
jgi:hypothetical protein